MHHLRCLLRVTFVVVAFCGSTLRTQAAGMDEPRWVAFGIYYVNLSEVVKIEVSEGHVAFIGPGNKVLEPADLPKDVLDRLRSLLLNSPNWVEISKSRMERQEWYANIARVPCIISSNAAGGVKAAALSWENNDLGDPKALIGIVRDNNAASKVQLYVAHGGYALDRAAQ